MNDEGRTVGIEPAHQEQTVIAGAVDEPLVTDEAAPIVPELRPPAPQPSPSRSRSRSSTRPAGCGSPTATR